MHLATWMPFLYGAADAVRSGWLPVGDDAEIAVRSWDVFTRYGSLVGLPNRLGHGVYDPGPLQSWLLSLPVRIDPLHGALWGAALLCMIACSLTIEAAWSAAGIAGGVLATASLLTAMVWIPDISRDPVWNPWFGMMFFLAALAAAWTVMAGHSRWGTVLVITASVAAQAHLMYALACGALVLVALIVGLVDTIRGRASYWWLGCCVIAGLACWGGPLIQEFTSPHGNLSTLLHNSGGTGHQGALAFGLRALAASVQPPPLWWTPLSALKGLSQASQRPAAFGVAALVIAAAILVATALRPLRSRTIAALAAVSLLASVAAVITFGAVAAASISRPGTASNSLTLTFLMATMLPVGILAWLTLGAAVAHFAGRFLARAAAARATAARALAARPAPEGGSRRAAARIAAAPWFTSAAALMAVGVFALASVQAAKEAHGATGRARVAIIKDVKVVSRTIEARLPVQPVALSVLVLDPLYRHGIILGLVYALETAGYRLEVAPASTFGGQVIPTVTVRMTPRGISVDIARAPAMGLGAHPAGGIRR